MNPAKELAKLDSTNAKEMVHIALDLMACGTMYDLNGILERFGNAITHWDSHPEEFKDDKAVQSIKEHVEVLKSITKFLEEVRQTTIGKSCAAIEGPMLEMLGMTKLSS